MPSFLNKVFGYKKSDDKELPRPTCDAPDGTTLLDGKYEAIPPMLSPSASTFAEAQQARDSDRDTAFSLFKHKYRGVLQKSAQKSSAAVPHLTLRLPGPKENSDSRALGTVFDADPVSQAMLDDAVIAAKRLTPAEALTLIRACAQTISERGTSLTSPQLLCSASQIRLGDSRNHASALVLRVFRCPAQTGFPLYPFINPYHALFNSQRRNVGI